MDRFLAPENIRQYRDKSKKRTNSAKTWSCSPISKATSTKVLGESGYSSRACALCNSPVVMVSDKPRHSWTELRRVNDSRWSTVSASRKKLKPIAS